MTEQSTTYYLDSLAGGSGPGNNGSDFAVFRKPSPTSNAGKYQMYTSHWISCGRPISIEVMIPGETAQ